MTPSGVTGVCGSRPSVRATCLVGARWIASPSSSTAPAVGRSSRAMPRSSVDLPQALAPTTTVICAVGDAQRELVDDGAVAVAEADALGDAAGRSGWRWSWWRSCRPPSGAAAGEQPEQERCAERAGDDADGEVDVGEQVGRDVVGDDAR